MWPLSPWMISLDFLLVVLMFACQPVLLIEVSTMEFGLLMFSVNRKLFSIAYLYSMKRMYMRACAFQWPDRWVRIPMYTVTLSLTACGVHGRCFANVTNLERERNLKRICKCTLFSNWTLSSYTSSMTSLDVVWKIEIVLDLYCGICLVLCHLSKIVAFL